MADLHGFLRDAGGGLRGVLGGGQIRCMNFGMDSCMDCGMRAAWIFRHGFAQVLQCFWMTENHAHPGGVSCCVSCSLGDCSCT